MNIRALIVGIAMSVAALSAGQIRSAAPAATFPAMFAGLKDQNARRFDPASLAGRFVLVNFIFTGCGSTCPTQTMQLARFERSLPPRVRARIALVSVSVDPANDTPQVLRRYADSFAIRGRHWQFLTGDPRAIIRVTRALSAMRPDRTDAAFHTSELRLFDPRHRMIQRYSGAPLAEAQLRADLLALTAPRS